ncbi:hypothetical protein LIER_28660 [Lithospermum erythrorhizon]|uniref:MULE transposase domain-containing protein n=1 Tax=Lithospermum erythrorhizon TaxID=34254 RepID=A0AAV3RMG4_LITER
MSKTAVPPRDILSFIKLQNPENRSTSKTIYNFRQLVKEEELNGHSVPQYLFKLLEDNGYGYSIQTEPGTNVLSDVLFVHPDSIKLLHAFPYVLIMDSTYNTNRYKLPLFQIVGFVSTGRTFTAGYGFLSFEKTEVYTWVLDTFQTKFLKEPPGVIVTDRELGLIVLHIGTPGPTPKAKWMSAGEMGLIITTKFNILFVIFSTMQSLTCLPLTLTSALPEKEEIVIGYLEIQEHFIWLKMCKDFPLPPIHSNWRHHCDDSVAELPSRYSIRLQKFREIQATNPAARSPVNVDD